MRKILYKNKKKNNKKKRKLKVCKEEKKSNKIWLKKLTSQCKNLIK